MSPVTTHGKNWLASLESEAKERVFSKMRAMRMQAEGLKEEHRALSPPPGSIPAGGAHMDLLWKACALEDFLADLTEGANPKDAAQHALEQNREYVGKWNRTREYQVHRWLDTNDNTLQDCARRMEAAAKGED